jgi:hypothetical protein
MKISRRIALGSGISILFSDITYASKITMPVILAQEASSDPSRKWIKTLHKLSVENALSQKDLTFIAKNPQFIIQKIENYFDIHNWVNSSRKFYHKGLFLRQLSEVIKSQKISHVEIEKLSDDSLKKAANLGHPSAMFLAPSIGSFVDVPHLLKAAHHGSVDAYARLSGYTTHPLRNWMKDGLIAAYFDDNVKKFSCTFLMHYLSILLV